MQLHGIRALRPYGEDRELAEAERVRSPGRGEHAVAPGSEVGLVHLGDVLRLRQRPERVSIVDYRIGEGAGLRGSAQWRRRATGPGIPRVYVPGRREQRLVPDREHEPPPVEC